MTHEEAQALKTFKHYCTCGGYAFQMNGRKKEQPHMAWCPQAAEYAEWYSAMNAHEPPKGVRQTGQQGGGE